MMEWGGHRTTLCGERATEVVTFWAMAMCISQKRKQQDCRHLSSDTNAANNGPVIFVGVPVKRSWGRRGEVPGAGGAREGGSKETYITPMQSHRSSKKGSIARNLVPKPLRPNTYFARLRRRAPLR